MTMIEFKGFNREKSVCAADIPNDTWFVNMEGDKPILYYKGIGKVMEMSGRCRESYSDDIIFTGVIDVDVQIYVKPQSPETTTKG